MENPDNKTNVRVLRTRTFVVDKESKDGPSTPSKLGTPSKRTSTPSKLGTPSKRTIPSKIVDEASGGTTMTRRRLSTKLESVVLADKLEPRLIMNKLPEVRTPSRRRNRIVSESDESPEVTLENITSARKDSKKDETSPAGAKKGNLSVSSPENIKVSFKDQSSPIADKKVNGDLSPILENGKNSDHLQNRKQLSKNQSSPKADNKAKGDLPPISENVEESDNSIIENSFQLGLNVTDNTKNEVQKSPSKRQLIDKSPDKSNREETIQSPSPKAKDKKLARSSPAKSVSSHLEPLQSDEQDQSKILECGSIVQEEESGNQGEESIRSVEREDSIESVDQEKESSEIVNQANESSTSVHQEEETNESVNQEEKTSKFPNQVEKSSLEEESDKSINQEREPSEIVITDEECSNPVDQGEESSTTLFIEKESSISVDQVNESICPVECNAADATPNAMVNAENSSIVQSSPSKKCTSNSEDVSNVIGETVEAVEDDIPSKGRNMINISLEDESKSNNVSFELVEQFQDTSAVNTSHDNKVDDDTENSTQPVADQLECKKLCENSPSKVTKSPKSSPSMVCSPRKYSSPREISAVTSPLCQRLPSENNSPSKASPEKVVCNEDASGKKILNSDSPKTSLSMVCSPRKHSSPQLSKINAVTSPIVMCQRLPSESNSPSKSVERIGASPEKVVCNEVASGKKLLDSDSDSDDSDLPPQIPSKDISQKKSPCSTDSHVTIKSTPSPNKVLKIIKPVQSEKLHEMKNLIKSIFEAQPISNQDKTVDESQKETSTGLDELRISRKELTLIVKEAIDDALVGLRNDVLEVRKELSDLKTLRRKEEEQKSKHLKEENMEECPVLVKRKKDLVVEHLLAKQAAQIFSDSDSSPKKKKSPKKNKQSTQVAVSSGSESCSTLPVTHQPKLKKRKIIEGEEIENKNIEEGDDNLTTNVEVRKRRKRKRKTATLGKTEETPIEPTHVDVEPVEQSNNFQDDVISESKPKKKRKHKKHENKDKEDHLVESTHLFQANPLDALENLSKKSKKKQQSELFNVDCMNVDNFDHQTISEEKKEKKEKKHKKKNAEQMDELSSNNLISLDIDRDELEQPLTEGKKKKKKKHVEQTDELHSTKNASLPNLDSNEFEQQPLNEVKKKKKKCVEQIEEFSQDLSPKNVTSSNQNPLFGQLLKIKKQKLKKNLKPKSNFNISQQHLKSYMEEFCDFKPKDNVKLNSFEDGTNEALKSKDSKKLKTKKKNKINDSFETEKGKKDVKHSKRGAKDSHKLTPSTTLDVTNFWL